MPQHAGIIVLGPPRSGTTLMRRLLDAHPNIACPSETNLLNACGRFLKSEVFAEGLDIGVLAGLSFLGFSEAEVLERLRGLAFSFFQDHATRQGKPRWAEKSAFDSFYLDEIEKLAGDHAYFICVQRHGLDVACSLRELCDKSGGYVPELHAYLRIHPSPLAAFTHAWVDVTERILRFVQEHPNNSILIRYEELAAEPNKVMRRVLDGVQEPWHANLVDDAMANEGQLGFGDWKTLGRTGVDQSSVGRFDELTAANISSLGRIANPTLLKCGYEAVRVMPELTPEEGRRRYDLGMRLQVLRGDGGQSK